MNTAKKVALAVALVLVGSAGWFALRPRSASDVAVPPSAGPLAADVAASSSAEAAPAPVDAPNVERMAIAASDAAAAPTGALLVHVQWSDQRAAAGIGVRVGMLAAPNLEASVITARTGDDGTARFERLAVGRAWVELDRGVQRECVIRAGACSEATLVIPLGVTIHGRVFDVDGRAAAGADIYMLHAFLEYAGHVVARADADGAFAIVDAPAERPVSVSARMPARAPTGQHLVTAAVGATVDLELRFTARGGAVAGRVVDGDGQAMAGATVLVGPDLPNEGARRAQGLVGPLHGQRVRSDERGEWLVDGVPAGDTPVLVVAPGMAPWRGAAFVIEGTTVRRDASLQPAARLVGAVTDEHKQPVPGAMVRVGTFGLAAAATTADGAGRFVLGGLPIEAFPALASAEGAGEARAEFVGVAGTDLAWNPVLVRATTLRGRLVADGRGVAGGMVMAHCMPSAQQQWFRDATTDADGRFELTNCPDALLHLDARTRDSGPFLVVRKEDVDPRDGDVTLEVDAARAPTAHVTGRVLDPAGEPVAGAEVLVLATVSDWGGGHSLRTGEDGRFVSPACPPGEWYGTVHADGFAQRGAPLCTLTAGANVDWGDLVLARGTTVVVTLQPEAGLDLDGLAVGLADANCGYAVERPEHGVVRFDNIGPGAYELTAYAPGIALRRVPVTVTTAPENALVLPLAAGSEVRVDVRDARGEALIDRFETELRDGRGACIDRSPLTPGAGPIVWLRRLVAGHYELRLRDHLGRGANVVLDVPPDGGAVRAVARVQ